ncbi:8095_t:CDS:10, partial [Paraglomus occultum]
LLDELAALESANIHAMVESDDRLNSVIRQLDKAISELDNMDSMLTLYTTELNSMGDEIHHIESQNRGLQVETANQKALLADLERLINLITISDQVLQTLLGESLNTIHGVQKIEEAADILQKALLTSYDESTRGMAAVKEKMGLYTQYSNQFCLNFCEFMKQAIKYQADNLISDKTREPRRDSMTILGHEKMEEVLLRYMSLSLWLKEIDPRKHNELQLAYVVSAEQIYRKETKEYLTQIRSMLSKREISEEATYAFSAALIQGHHRSSLIYGSADHGRAPWEFKDSGRGKLPPEEAFEQILLTLVPLIVHEQNFISDFFHIGSKGPKSFQDRAELASWHPKELNGTREVIKDVKAQRKLLEHMEKVFGFLPEELSSFIDQCVGMIARIEKYIKEYEKTSQEFFVKVMKQARAQCITIFERFMVEQLKAIEDTKVTTKKRKGIVLFIKIFPRFCERIEHSMAGVASLEIRDIVNRAYETLVKTMFDSLEAIARDVSSINDDKEQLNVHIMILENMHHFHNEIRMRKILVLDPYTVYAKSSYEKHLEAYARKVLQKPFSKLIEFFDGIDNLLKTSAPEEVGFHMRYSKESLKKLTEHYTAREIKKGLEQLYKRVEKHFTEEEGLLRVVWGIIGQVVIDNHKHFIDLINRCYPDSNIKLEYSLSDLQNFIKVVHEGRKS